MTRPVDVPRGRIERFAKMAGVGIRTGADALLAGDLSRNADKVAAALGDLRGLAAKIGQMASYIDGLVPVEHADAFERSMSALQQATPASSPRDIASVIGDDLAGEVDDFFDRFDTTPIASASVGQVHRAVTLDGDDVAVKVQHPGVREAMENDLNNAGVLELAMGFAGARKFETQRLLEEARAKFLEELDYELEADRQAIFARIHADNARIVVPHVYEDLCGPRVLTSAFVQGIPFAQAREASLGERQAWARTLWEFVYGAMHVGGYFNADPHPGNYLFGTDGKIAFLDYGCVLPMDEERRLAGIALHQAAIAGDERAFRAVARGALNTHGGHYERMAIDYAWACYEPVRASGPYRITREYTASLVRRMKDMIRELRTAVDDDYVPIPDGLLFINRLQFGFYSVLARLDVSVDYAAVDARCVSRALAGPAGTSAFEA